MIYRFKKNLICFVGFSLLSFLIGNCGYYSFKGSLEPHLKTVAIPMFEDQTAEFGVKEELTDELIKVFIEDNSLKISDRQNSDILIEGRISSITDQTGNYNQDEEVSDLQVHVNVSVKCTDQVKRKVMWEGTVSRWGRFTPDNLDSRREGISGAIKELALEILNKTVAGW